MDNFCPIPGLTIPDNTVLCDATDETDDVHVRVHVLGEEAALTKYWAITKRSEILSETYLNEIVGLADTSDTAFMNGVDLFFSGMLGRKALVVELRTENLGAYHTRALDFIQRERPLNTVVIVNSL